MADYLCKKCDNPDCPRFTLPGIHYCCTPCYIFHTQTDEAAKAGPAHSPGCDARQGQRQKP